MGGVDGQSINTARIYVDIIGLYGRSACSVFAIISGFFLCESGWKGHFRHIVPLIAEMIFYSIFIWLLMYMTQIVPTDLRAGVNTLFPLFMKEGASGYWFLIAYVIVYSMAPALNRVIHEISKNTFRVLLITLIVIYVVIPTFTGNNWAFGSIFFFIFMYLVGSYIKLYVYGKIYYNNRYNLIIALSAALFMALSVVVIESLAYPLGRDSIMKYSTYFGAYNTIPAFLFAVFLFMYFANKSFHIPAINVIASTTMGIYLIHENEKMRIFLWTMLWPYADYAANPYLHSLLKISFVFAVCCMIDLVRSMTVGRVFNWWFDKRYDGIERKVSIGVEKLRMKIALKAESIKTDNEK